MRHPLLAAAALWATAVMIAPAPAPSAPDVTLTAPDGSPVEIRRDEYGVPHILGTTEVGVFYGQGYALGGDRLYQAELNRREALGRLAELEGAGYVALDIETRTMYYTEAERAAQFAALPPDMQAMFTAFVAGVNTYLDSMAVRPDVYRPLELKDVEVEPWTPMHSVAVMQGLARRFGQFGGQELTRLQELEAHGQNWFDQYRPINSPAAPTTIPDGARAPAARTWRSSCLRVRPEAAEALERREGEVTRLRARAGLPPKLGSFAVQITTAKSATGNVLLLGCPQMGEPQSDEPNAVHEVELCAPGFHVGGMTVAGVPGLIIGHSEYFAWTLTSGISDNTDVYVETTKDESFTSYLYRDRWEPFEARPDTVFDSEGGVHPFTVYRTVHGPVFGDDLAANQAYTKKMTFWERELDMAAGIYAIQKAKTAVEFEAGVALLPMSFNVFRVGVDQKVHYWHAGLYQDRSDGVDPRLPHNGDGSEEWGGLRAFGDLPTASEPAQGFFVNWNNKPVRWWDNGDNVPWTSSWHPVLLIRNYVAPIAAFTFEDLEGTPQAISSHGTYQQAVEFAAGGILDENLVPPGQSAFVSLGGVPSAHVDDQWALHVAWQFKDMQFGETFTAAAERIAADLGTTPVLRTTPNPFSRETRVHFSTTVSGRVRMDVYDVAGRHVRTLVDEVLDPGVSAISWDGCDEAGAAMPAGLYLCRVESPAGVQTQKMVLLR